MIFACFCRQINKDDPQENELIDDAEDLHLKADEEYLHSTRASSYTMRATVTLVSLSEHEVIHARQDRLKEIEMWSIIRRCISYLVFLSLISTIIYSSREHNSFFQVQHLRSYFLNTRQPDLDFMQVCHHDLVF